MEIEAPFTGTGPNGGEKENCANGVTDESWVAWFGKGGNAAPALQILGTTSSSEARGPSSRIYFPYLPIPANTTWKDTLLTFQ